MHCCCICLEFPDLKQLLSSERLLVTEMGVSPKRRKQAFILLTISNPKVFDVFKNIIWKTWLLLGTIQYILEVTSKRRAASCL